MKVKKGMRVLSLLMVMALLGAVFVPAVSAESILQSDSVETNVKYDEEKYTIRIVDPEITQDQINAQTKTLMNLFEKEFNKIKPRFIGIAESDISSDEKVVGYAFRILPDGESFSYIEVANINEAPDLKETSSQMDIWIDGSLKIKTNEYREKKDYGTRSYGPMAIHTATISRTYSNIGRAYLTTTWYWDNQETNSNQDYFFTKTTLRTDPGIDISGYEPYKNYLFNVEINSDYSLGSYQHLPGVHVSQNNPQTTSGYTTIGLSLGTGSCSLGWSTAIPDTHVELHLPSGNIYNWDEEFSFWASCAATTFEFTPGQNSYCTQSSARNGNTYIVSRVKADVSKGWVKMEDGILHTSPTGTNTWGHYCKVQWNGGYNHI